MRTPPGGKRLCMLVHGPYPVGEPRVSRETAVALDAGWEVDVVAMSRPGEPKRERVEGADVHRLPLSHAYGGGLARLAGEYTGFALLATATAGRLFRERRYSIVQVHAPPDFLILAALAPKALGSRVVLDIHDLSSDMFGMRFGDRRGASAAERGLRAVEHAATHIADAVITVHEPYRRELIARGVPPAKIEVVMNTVDERLLPDSPAASSHDGFRVVYHGAVTPAYGLDLLVEAAASLPDARVEIYGAGDAVGNLSALARGLGISDRVHVDGRSLPHAEVLARIEGADAGVVPNLPTPLNRYALSSKLFEYVALGIPAVVARLPTLQEHFAPEEVRFFDAGSAESLASALEDVARDPEGARKRAEAAKRRYQHYRWPRQADRYLALLERLRTG